MKSGDVIKSNGHILMAKLVESTSGTEHDSMIKR